MNQPTDEVEAPPEVFNPYTKDPYAEVPQEKKARISVDIPVADKHLIQAVCPQRGILQGMINSFLLAVVTELRAKGIRYNDTEMGGNSYEQFVNIVGKHIEPDVYKHGPYGKLIDAVASNVPSGTPDGRRADTESHRVRPEPANTGAKVAAHPEPAKSKAVETNAKGTPGSKRKVKGQA